MRARLAGLGRAAVARVAAGYIRLCWATTRWTVEGAEHRAAMIASGAPIVAAFWHGRLIFSPLWKVQGRPTLAMISANRDGELFARIAARFGIGLVRGSSRNPRKPGRDRGGRAASIEALRALRTGAIVAIAVDGPRGPRMRCQPGVATLSAAAGAVVAPIAFSTRRGRLIDSWDRFLLPLPLDRGALVYGAPLPPPAGGDPDSLAAHLAAIETALLEVTRRADTIMDRTPVRP